MTTAQSILEYMSPATILALFQDMSEMAVAQLIALQGEEQTKLDLVDVPGVSA